MTATKRVFLSDIHLGTDQSYDWYKRTLHEANMLATLDYVLDHKDEIKDLVLLGDALDTWVCPIGNAPPTPAQILEANSKVVDKLRACVGALQAVFFVNGNHDMSVAEADLAPLTHGTKRVRHVPAYQAGMLYGEHGSRFAMFNAPDRMHDVLHGLPVGYYISRVLAGHPSYLKPSDMVSYADDLLVTVAALFA